MFLAYAIFSYLLHAASIFKSRTTVASERFLRLCTAGYYDDAYNLIHNTSWGTLDLNIKDRITGLTLLMYVLQNGPSTQTARNNYYGLLKEFLLCNSNISIVDIGQMTNQDVKLAYKGSLLRNDLSNVRFLLNTMPQGIWTLIPYIRSDKAATMIYQADEEAAIAYANVIDPETGRTCLHFAIWAVNYLWLEFSSNCTKRMSLLKTRQTGLPPFYFLSFCFVLK